jgi:hypothetical protein
VVSKYLIFKLRTSSSSCSMVTLNRSPSSLCKRKKKAPWLAIIHNSAILM